MSLSASPQPGTDYIYTTAYYAKGSTWLPITLTGNNAAPSYSTGIANGTLSASILSTLPIGTNYIVLWDWLWDSTAQCYKGPGLNQCNTGAWRLQTFSLTQSASGPQVSISPTTLTFPSTLVGITSAAETVTLTNIGAANLAILTTFVDAGDFKSRGTCAVGTSYAPGTGCLINITFTPTAAGTRTGSVTLTDNAASSPQTITLTGTGVLTSPTPTPSPSGCISGCNNYYVSTTGSDSNPGTQASPWATINHADVALTLGSGGTIVHVAPGTYSAAVITSKSGNSGARIRYVSDTQYGARLAPPSANVIWQEQGAYVDIVGFDFDGTGHTANNNGAYAYNQDVLIQGNKFHDIGSACFTSQNAVVASFFNTQSGHGNRFIGNLIYHNNCGAGHPSGVGSAMSALSGNSYDIMQDNIILDHGTGYVVQICHGFPINGVYTCVGGTFTNNTILNVDRGVVLFYGSTVDDYFTVTNNIIGNITASNYAGILIHGGNCGPHNIVTNNLIYGASIIVLSDCTNLTATGTLSGSNTTTFVNYTGTITGDYHLKAGSAAIDAGTTTCATSGCVPATDITGKARPSPPSIGAYEQ